MAACNLDAMSPPASSPLAITGFAFARDRLGLDSAPAPVAEDFGVRFRFGFSVLVVSFAGAAVELYVAFCELVTMLVDVAARAVAAGRRSDRASLRRTSWGRMIISLSAHVRSF